MDLNGSLAIICIFGWPLALIAFGAFRMYLKHQVQMLDRKLLAQGQVNSETKGEMAALRQELAQLRDTSTQYDISIQHTLEDLQRRMASIEATRRSAPLPADETQQPVSAGVRRS